MKYERLPSSPSASHFQDYFETAFAGADLAASWWQPFLKGVGRSQLELASMQSRNAQAMLQWTRDVAGSRSFLDVISANAALCQALANHVGDAFPKVSGALSQATQPPPAFELLPLPVKRTRDSLVIADTEAQVAKHDYEQRRVA
jgi:hypothetical protein